MSPAVRKRQSSSVPAHHRDPTVAVPGTEPLNSDPARGNGFRFRILLDRTKTSSGQGKIVIDKVQVYFNC